MFKKMFFVFITATLALSACSTLEISIDQTPTPTQIPTAEATSTPGATATPSATDTPAANGPTFSNVSFYRTSFRPAECGQTYQRTFPARILQVHARWDYANMRDGLIVRRVWYHNGVLWAEHQELWDFAKYGAAGTVDDTNIYDYDAGLEPGTYELRLYINELSQFDAESKISFVVEKDWSLEIASPNGRLTAVISEPQKLMIRESNGTKWELARGHEISGLAWFADSTHIVYSDTDWSQTQNCTTAGIRHTLWIVDAATGTQYQIGSNDQNLHAPLLSPDGKYIAALSGSGFGDACVVDLKRIWIELDSKFRQFRSYWQQDFAGIPAEADGSIIFPTDDGVWKDETHFETGLTWTCAPANDPSGMYLFDLPAKQATRTGDLPQP